MKHKILKAVLLLCLSAILGVSQVFAQRQVSGTVTDGETGDPIPGVNILEQGTTNGSITDLDGKFSISVAGDNAVLVFSFIGFATQEVPVGNRSVVDINLAPDVLALSEIVVIGYGTQTKEDATGAVATIGADDFNRGQISSPEQLIQGKTSGVQVTATSGQPGAETVIRIRGTNSVRSNNNPLFVVDGVPLDGGNTSGIGADIGFGSAPASNPLTFLNPSDIESISVLKDASATAIYGSRGANGVVIITTKKGKGAGGQWDVSLSGTVSVNANEYDLLERDDFLQAVDDFGGNVAEADFGESTDWQDQIFRTAFSPDFQVGYSRGYKTGAVRASFGYEYQQGTIDPAALERITGRINWSQALFADKVDLGLTSTYSRVNQQNAPLSGSAGFRGDLLGAVYSANPTWPVDADFDAGGQINPINFLQYHRSTNNTDRVLANINVAWHIIPELTAKVTYGLDWSDGESVQLSTASGRNIGDAVFGNGFGGYNETRRLSNLVEATLQWNKTWSNSKLDLLGGYSYQDFQFESLDTRGWGFDSEVFEIMEGNFRNAVEILNDQAESLGGFVQQFGLSEDIRNVSETSGFFVNQLIPEVNQGVFLPRPNGIGGVQSITGDKQDFTDALQSFFARANYTLRDKYLFTFTVRADGSSRFGENNRYGVFPSGAFAWRIDQEPFMGDGVSTLKLRLNAGITGNQDGLGYGNFLRRERFGTIGIGNSGEINVPGTSPVAFANPDLKWEENIQYGAGIDFGFNNDRLYGAFDFYYKESQDIILRLNAAQPSPQDFVFQNFPAVVTNVGFEFQLGYNFVQTNDWDVSADMNLSYNDNEITEFDGQIPAGTIRGQGLSQAFAQMLAGNQPLFSYFLRIFEGFDDAGQPIGDNQTFVGEDALPDWLFGFNLNLRYKRWDLAAYVTGQYGFSVYNNTANAFFTAGSIANARNVTRDVLGSGEAGSAAAEVSTRFLENGNFTRMQTFNIGYNIPTGDRVNNLRVYFNAQNLFLITNYSGIDPEVATNPGADEDFLNRLPTAGIDYTAFPRPRTFTLGVNLSF